MRSENNFVRGKELTDLLNSEARSPVVSCLFVFFVVFGRKAPFVCGHSVKSSF